MKTAIYPGSFNPWHRGHTDILSKALDVFDHVIIVQGTGAGKSPPQMLDKESIPEILRKDITIRPPFSGMLPDFIKELDDTLWKPICAVVRGLRNGYDLQYEQNQMYWYQDLGLTIPVICFITDRDTTHISSSAIREIEKIKNA